MACQQQKPTSVLKSRQSNTKMPTDPVVGKGYSLDHRQWLPPPVSPTWRGRHGGSGVGCLYYRDTNVIMKAPPSSLNHLQYHHLGGGSSTYSSRGTQHHLQNSSTAFFMECSISQERNLLKITSISSGFKGLFGEVLRYNTVSLILWKIRNIEKYNLIAEMSRNREKGTSKNFKNKISKNSSSTDASLHHDTSLWLLLQMTSVSLSMRAMCGLYQVTQMLTTFLWHPQVPPSSSELCAPSPAWEAFLDGKFMMALASNRLLTPPSCCQHILPPDASSGALTAPERTLTQNHQNKRNLCIQQRNLGKAFENTYSVFEAKE